MVGSSLEQAVAAVAGALVGGTVVGAVVLGYPAMDVMTSVSGGAGAALGYGAGVLATKALSEASSSTSAKMQPFVVFAGCVAVPALAGGTLDKELLMIAGGAWAGGMVIQKVMEPVFD